TEVLLLATAEYTHFFDGDELEPESFALAQGQVTRALSADWKLGTAAQYIFSHQVFDVSATEADFATATAQGHAVVGTPSIEWMPGKGWRTELLFNGGRQLFTEPLDDYWEVNPVLRIGREFTREFDVSLHWRLIGRWFDERAPLDAEGYALPGTLRFTQNELELRPRVRWGTNRLWSVALRLGALDNQDNGGGYFDYQRYAVGGQLRGGFGRWTFRAGTQWFYYDYPVQRVAGPESALRDKSNLSILLRGEFRLGRKVSVFAQYDRESAQDGLADAGYDVNMGTVGIEWNQ
ncbi:MAG: hypothetical protein ACYC23_24400, partial [Limisphaerales bacterium]